MTLLSIASWSFVFVCLILCAPLSVGFAEEMAPHQIAKRRQREGFVKDERKASVARGLVSGMEALKMCDGLRC